MMAGLTTTDLAAALLRDVRDEIHKAIHDPGKTEGKRGDRTLTAWQTDAVMRAVLAALTAALDGVDERAVEVIERLRNPIVLAVKGTIPEAVQEALGPLIVDRVNAADLITALLAQNAALAASEARVAKLVEEIKRLTEVIDSTADYLEENHQSQGKPYRWLRAATTEEGKQ